MKILNYDIGYQIHKLLKSKQNNHFCQLKIIKINGINNSLLNQKKPYFI